MMDDCRICQGRKTVRLPVYNPVVVSEMRPTAPITVNETYRTYPCPECADVVPMERVAVIEVHCAVSAEIDDPRFLEHARRSAAHRLLDQILESGALTFTRGPTNRDHVTYEIRAVLGIVTPKVVASLEERISKRQAEVAQEVADEAAASIRVWRSQYTGDEGAIAKGQAVSSVMDALRTVLERRLKARAPTPERGNRT